MKMIFAVAAGGALGAVGRFLLSSGTSQWLGHGFPFGTLIANIVGSFLLGILLELSAMTWTPSPEFRAFLSVGFLGAFTTFSTFSLDAVTLWQRGELMTVGIYVGGSVLIGISGFLLGIFMVKSVLS